MRAVHGNNVDSSDAEIGKKVCSNSSLHGKARKAVLLQTTIDGRRILVDSGSEMSHIPALSKDRVKTPNLTLFKTANGSALPVYGIQ